MEATEKRTLRGVYYLRRFPRLTPHNHWITSPRTKRYNCIAWAAGLSSKWWWPAKDAYWPENARMTQSVGGFLEAFGTLGYEECEDGSFEAGYEKVALYAREKPDGSLWPTHAARQLPNQRWTSKLGKLEDIIHDNQVATLPGNILVEVLSVWLSCHRTATGAVVWRASAPLINYIRETQNPPVRGQPQPDGEPT